MGLSTFNLDEPFKSRSRWQVGEMTGTTCTWKSQHVSCLRPIKFSDELTLNRDSFTHVSFLTQFYSD